MSRTFFALLVIALVTAIVPDSSYAAIRMVLAEEFTGLGCYYCP